MKLNKLLIITLSLIIILGTSVFGDQSVINLNTEGDWTQEDAAAGTDFGGGIVNLHDFGGGGTTADLCNGGSATTDNPNPRGPERAFDNANTFYGDDAWYSVTFPTWIKYDFGSGTAHRIVKYTVAATSRVDVPPTAWTFECSNDNNSWNILDTQSGITSWSNFEQKNFTFSNSNAYRYCLLNVTTSLGGLNIEIGEIEMMASVIAYPTSQSYYIYSNNAQIDSSLWGGIDSVTLNQSTPASTSLKYLISFDGRTTWKYWTGSAWSTSSLANLQTNGMTKATIEAITQAQWSASGGFSAGTLDFAIDLKTTDDSVTPEVYGIIVDSVTELTISNPQPANNSELNFGTTNTTLGVTTNFNTDCKYSTSSGQAFSSMIAFSTTGTTSHSSIITGLSGGTEYDYYIKCNDTVTGNITDDYHIHFNVSNISTENIDFSTEGDWTQEDAAAGTDFGGGIVNLHDFGGGGTTADLCNGGSATTDNPNPRGPERAFDNANTAYGDDAWYSISIPTWIKYDFGSGTAHRIVKYTVAATSRVDVPPTAWTFECSNDNNSWNILDTQSGITSWSNFEQKNFTFSNSNAYRYCLLNVTTSLGGGSIEIGEIEMMASVIAYPTSQSYYIYSNNAQIDTSLWDGINSVTLSQSTPASTSIKYLVSFDGRSTWKYWIGSIWSASSLANLQTNGMEKSTIEGITEPQWSASGGFSAGTLDFAIDLKTTDSGNTPELTGISIDYSGGVAGCIDNDGDGWGASGSNLTSCNFTSEEDCNDNNASINPNAYDIPNNGIDEDCSGADATASYEARVFFHGETGYSGLGYFIGDDINYEISFKKNNVSSDEDISSIIVNLTNVWGNVLKSQTLPNMDHPNTGNWTGTFTTDDLSSQDDDKVNLKVYAYGSGGALLAWRTHGDEWFATGTTPLFSTSNFNYFTDALSNYTVRDFAANSSFGLINWSGTTLDLSTRTIDLDSAITMADKLVVIDSASYSELNASATLTFENVNCASPYVYYSETETTRINILAEDNLCTAPRCTNIQCSNDVLTVTVNSFSGYAVEGNSNLTIDADDPKAIGEDVSFIAEYLNASSGSLITGADCEIFFTDGNYMMTEEATEYTYNRTFSSSGIKEYNVTCNHSTWNTLTAYDNATITTGVGPIPEFSTITLGIGLIVVLAGLVLIRRKD